MSLKKLPIRVLACGLGAIGQAVVRQVIVRDGFKVVGAVDLDPTKAGRDLGEVAALDRALRVRVGGDLAKAIRATRPDVVALCTTSSMKQLRPTIETVVALKVPVVTTCEELVYPAGSHVKIARAIHELAVRRKVAVLGTGVNPGFAMDSLAIALTAVCEQVETIRIDRVQDARTQRLAFQQKIGCGLTREQFQQHVDEGRVRHVGFAESISMIAAAMGWRLDRITDDIQPKIAVQTAASEYIAVDPGYVCGIVQDGRGFRDGKALVHLHMEAYLGAADSYDAVTIEGSPRIVQKVHGGIHGDIATASLVVNSIPRVIAAAPGLHTMRDMPLPAFEPLRARP